ncbi:hypothetical protein RsoM2USA_331 [Ralstonia phage RsoM2USA]|nr:hypothetical protein RsoM2USA_331 [Ralstonia phage RsoM2USA]
MKLSEISINHLSNEAVNEFLYANDIVVHGPPGMPDYEIVSGEVEFYSQDVVVRKIDEKFGVFKFPFKYSKISFLQISGRTIESWNDFPDSAISYVFFDDCKIPSLGTIPHYASIRLGVRYDFSDNIIPLFEYGSDIYFSLYDPTNEYEICIITKKGTGPIEIDRHTDHSKKFTDVFDFQSWLVDNGYERLT